jgi:acyl-CoA reductase-like NAD-dependent aldehyde dehydrogenase
LLEYRDVYAGGRLVGSGSADVITIVNPATEEVAGAVPSMVGTDVEVAVTAARRAFDAGPWPQLRPAERAAAMVRLAAALEARAEDAARLVTAEMGMPIQLSRRNNVTIPCGIIRYYAALARDMSTEEVREAVSFAGRTMVRREPVGVAAVVASWSYPLILAFCQLAPALAAGCTIVLKPAAETSLSGYILAEAFEAADFPPGVFNLVTGTGQVAEMLAAHPCVDIVAVAGPTSAGRRIAAISAGSRPRSCSTTSTYLLPRRSSAGCALPTPGRRASPCPGCWPRGAGMTRRFRPWPARLPGSSWATRWPRRQRWGRWRARGSGSGWNPRSRPA